MNVGEVVEYMEIRGNGEVVTAHGRIFSEAPAFKGMKAWWTDDSVLVVKASKRYESGIRIAGRWRSRDGLVIEKGQMFTETDSRSALRAHVAKLHKAHERAMRPWVGASAGTAAADGGA